jgi:carbamoyl-phosphate synthase small subunit
MTGYQEVMTDPSYAGQIIAFTFPHIGNVGANGEDLEATTPWARGIVLAGDITEPSNWRATRSFDDWLRSNGLVGIAGIDTRRLTRRLRDGGASSAAIAYAPDGGLDIDALRAEAAAWPGLDGMDLAIQVTRRQTDRWDQTLWKIDGGYGTQTAPRRHVVAVDYGAKRNILRALASQGCAVTIVPADTAADDILRHKPDGVFLSNGPGDPAATGRYAIPVLRTLIETGTPIFGICLGHQLLSLAVGGRTEKMHHGHRGANHPVKELETGRVEITSQNHGFVVAPESLPPNCEATHVSLFDGTNEGFRMKDRPVFAVQYHPEASPGPADSHHLFERFVRMMDKK